MTNPKAGARAARAAAGVLIVVACARCASNPTRYQQGRRDGCAAGYFNAGRPGAVFAFKEYIFSRDVDYGRGWIEGEEACYAAEMNYSRNRAR